ncbi:HAD-IA family hydrolase [Pararhodospirillum photometricum]|nr:HAD-IA family hydrolase [Pararhodospirillum photometricum]
MRALLFDCDGVLADTERDGHRVAFNHAFTDAGLTDHWSVDHYGSLLDTGGGRHRLRRHFGPELPEPVIADLHQRKTDHFIALVARGAVPLRPGVERLVDEALAAGLDIGVCSTSEERSVRAVVAGLGPARAQRIHIFAGDQVARRKPDPAIYRLALSSLGLDPDQALAIEDSAIGLAAARAAGLQCLVTRATYSRHERFPGAARVVDSLEDIRLADCRALLTDQRR